jgi:methionyl aminopeptidase
MSIESQRDFIGLSRAGKVVALALQEMKSQLRPDMTTAELDEIGARVLKRHGARSAPQAIYQFPGSNIICLNDEVVHGIPGDRAIRPGDLVTIDVTVELDGYIADAAITVPLSPTTPEKWRLCKCAQAAFWRAYQVARSGLPINVIGKAVEKEVKRQKFTVIRELTGHGTGRTIHEDPIVANYYDSRDRKPLTEGLVLTIEPLISAGTGRVVEDADGWTIRTADGSLSAHYEHTLVITRDRPVLLTAA